MPLRRRAAAADRHTFELVDDGFDDEPDLDGPSSAGSAGRVHWTGGTGPGVRAHDDVDAGAILDGLAGDDGRRFGDGTQGDDGTFGDGPDGHGPDGHGPDGDGPDGEAAEPTPRSPRRRRAVVGTAAAVVLVLGGMTAVDAVTQHLQTARLRDAPGGLAPIGDAPRVAWELDIELAGQPLGVMPGALVVNDGNDVVGYDLDTGEEAWRTTFDGPTSCGTLAQWYSAVSVDVEESSTCVPSFDVAVSVASPAEDWDPVPVAVLAADGTIEAARELGPPSGPVDGAGPGEEVRWIRPSAGPDGTLLWVGRIGPEAEQQGERVPVDESTGFVPVSGDPPDVALALQDVASGDLRWSAAVPARMRDEASYECAQWGASEGSGEEVATVDLDQAWGFGTHRAVHVQGCGVTASFTADGVRTDDPAVVGDVTFAHGDGYLRDPSGGSVMYGGSGLYDESGDPLRSALLAADGSVAWEAPGLLVPPLATDGRSELRFVKTGLTIAAFDGSGAELWEPDTVGTPEQVLVASAPAVLVSVRGALAALDPATGRTRWSVEPSALGGSGFSSGSVMQAFTDGRSAILVLSTAAPSAALVAIDLADGRVLWTEEGLPDAWSYLSVEGRLVSVGERSVALLR
ncbi:PQQ-binding-like beta-propeller repeat protein [Cellulosimicrobium sp. Marseille-Q4280]|uniref:outer membrane protein assembly factor BamB family protein n=1 Tax=Cellulosimicrobium sp. Marseille-Q4280 TaxID=2937992 RepID=UPI002040CA6B|nr:PQQ-binding-like beta-propeller repeat protein [Cellulosimicrobium sp. Marseille-Q4280]